MSSSVRHRPPVSSKETREKFSEDGDGLKPKHATGERRQLSGVTESLWLFIFAFYGVIFLFDHCLSSMFPDAVTEASALPGQFVEERARKSLNDLTGLGSRPVGSVANEQLAVDYLLNEVESIRRTMNSEIHKLDVDVQRVSGSFTLDFLGGFTSIYDNVNNIVVRLSPRNSFESHSLLVNCHYDTTFNTTGASDDTVSCSIMLEVLRVMSRDNHSFAHSVIFLFNGAEENVLQASHGFITKHPWAKDIKAFVNLEAAGAGGKELLFQSGPEHPWLISLYAKHAPHPFGNILGQEIFQTGVIPSDTDYRIYRDYGGLPGLDIAYVANGYVYHTIFDSAEMIPSGCIQRGGDNLLAVVKAIADSPYLAEPGEYRHGKIAFMDIFGVFMLAYPERVGIIINVATILGMVARFGRKLLGKGTGICGIHYFKHVLLALAVMTLSLAAAFISILPIALILDMTGNVMTWFSNPMLIFGLYFAPSLACLLAVCVHMKKLFYKDVSNMWDIEAVYFDVALYLHTALIAVMTFFGICSAILPLLIVLFPAVTRLGILSLLRKNYVSYRTRLAVHFIGLALPIQLLVLLSYSVFMMFIPIMGRAGDKTIPDVFIACIAGISVVMWFIWQIGMTFVTRSLKTVISVLSIIFIVTFFVAVCTSVGFPYRANPANPTRQRHIIHHTDRTFHNVSGDVIHQDYGILHIPFDRNGVRHLESVVPMSNSLLVRCEDLPYCGWPYYLPLIHFFQLENVKYLPTSNFEVYPRPQLYVIGRAMLKKNLMRVNLSISGPNHINIYMTPKRGVELVHWSVGDGHPSPTMMPPSTDRPHYFIFYSYGVEPKNPLEFSIDLRIEDGFAGNNGFIDIALGGYYLTIDGKEPLTQELSNYLAKLPDWTANIGLVASYESWII